jgi:hypothetical protein
MKSFRTDNFLQMKKLIFKIIIYSIAVFIVLNGLLFYVATENHFIGGIIQKHELLEKVAAPRIILIGGSGVAYSIDSEQITAATGREVVNMGVFAQFGLRYMLEEVQSDIRADDVVVVIPEYSHFYYLFNGWRGWNELIFVYPKALTYLNSTQQLKAIGRAFPRFYRQKVKTLGKNLLTKFKTGGQDNVAYNQYGDYVAHLDSKEVFDLTENGLFHAFIDMANLKLNRSVVPVLNNFQQKMTDKGATVYFSYPTIPELQFSNSKKIIEQVVEDLDKKANFERLNRPVEEVQPLDDFYDTVYHLKKDGRTRRTQRLIDNLLPKL